MNTDSEVINFIRKEMLCLDLLTGMTTAHIKIEVNDSYHLVGAYSHSTEKCYDTECFYFSRLFFTDSEIDEKILIHIIRHEYAHYLNYHIYCERGHGWWFKQCCKIIDCIPDEKIYMFLRKKAISYKALLTCFDKST